jgi:hypothetical protein
MRLVDEYSPETYIRLTKVVGRAPSRGIGAGDAAQRISGEGELGHPLYVGYVVDGWFFERPTIGIPMVFFRFRRNEFCRLGVFTSSYVTRIGETEIETENSLYRVECRSLAEWQFDSP